MQQAIELDNMQNGPYPEQVPTVLPTWLSDEVSRQKTNPVNPEDVLRALEGCQVCNENGIAGESVVVPGGSASPASAPSPTSEPAGFPAPAPAVAPVPVPVPAPIIAPVPVPVPAPAAVLAPAPAPVEVLSSPPPAPVVVPVSGALSAFKGASAVVAMSMVMVFV
jgi:hypothetical protein